MSSLSIKNVTARYDGKVNSTAQTQLPDTTPAVIQTEQASPHADLERIVRHHLGHPWRKPCPNHTQRAFEQLQSHYGGNPRPLILDSYCGTGMSSGTLFRSRWSVPHSASWRSVHLSLSSSKSRINGGSLVEFPNISSGIPSRSVSV